MLEAEGASRRVADAPTSLPLAFEFITTFEYGSIKLAPNQLRTEILGLLDRLGPSPPRRILELGTYKGGTLFLFTRVAALDATLVTVDLPSGPFGGGYRQSWGRLLRSFAREHQQIHLVRADSQSDEAYDLVRSLVAGPGTVDLLFVDADHTYDGVRSDYGRYAPLVRAGGLIAFHDIVPGDAKLVGDVPRFWRELKSADPTAEELVEDWAQGGYGIGIIRVPDVTADEDELPERSRGTGGRT